MTMTDVDRELIQPTHFWISDIQPDILHHFEGCDGFGWRPHQLVQVKNLTGKTVCHHCEPRKADLQSIR